MITRESLTDEEAKLLYLVYNKPGLKASIRKMLETGEGLTPEIKNSPHKDAALAFLSALLTLMEERGIGA